MESKLNNTIQLLASGDSFIGKNEVVNGYLNIICNLFTTKDCVITCEQSMNGTDYQFSDQFAHVVSVFGNITRTQFYVKAYYVRITVFNATVDDIPKIVLTTLFTDTIHDSSAEQPNTIVGSVSVLNSMKATYTDGGIDTLKNVACDENGVLKSNLVVEGITLTPQTDAISVYGSTDQSVANAKLLNTDVNGKLNVNITSLSLEPVDDGVSVYGSTDGTKANAKLLRTDVNGVLSVADAVVATKIDTLDAVVDKIEVNANKDNITTLAIDVATDFAVNADITTAIDLGTGKDRMRNVCFSGSVGNLLVNTNPKIIMSFSDNNNDFFEDGVYANFYKGNANEWTFNFQRSNIGQRYIKLKAQNATTINKCRITQSKL